MKKRILLLIGLLLCVNVSLFADTEPGELSEGLAAYHNDDLNAAIQYLNIAIQKDSQLWKAYEVLGYIYYKQGRMAEALAACDTSLKINPKNDPLVKFRDRLDSQIGATTVPDYVPPKPAPSTGTPLYPEKTKSLYFDFGGTNPYSPADFQTSYNPSFTVGAGIGFGISRIFSLIVSADFNSFALNETSVPLGYGVTGGALSDALVMVSGKFRFIPEDNPVVPYGVVGLGVAFYNAQPVTVTEETYPFNVESSTGLVSSDFAFRLALGIDIKMQSGSYLFIESNGVGTSTGAENIVYDILKIGFKYDFEALNSPAPK